MGQYNGELGGLFKRDAPPRTSTTSGRAPWVRGVGRRSGSTFHPVDASRGGLNGSSGNLGRKTSDGVRALRRGGAVEDVDELDAMVVGEWRGGSRRRRRLKRWEGKDEKGNTAAGQSNQWSATRNENFDHDFRRGACVTDVIQLRPNARQGRRLPANPGH